jgi:hypothetical protein
VRDRHLELRTFELQRRATGQARAEALRDSRPFWRSAPAFPVRQLERALTKVGRLRWETSHARPLARAFTPAPPRFLVRIDEFPHYQSRDEPDEYGTPFMREFMSALGELPLLVAVVPRGAHDALDPHDTGSLELQPDELRLLAELREQGCVFALHGLTHRTRHAHPRRRSELSGLEPPELLALVDEGLELLARAGIETRVFVPPFNRFDRSQFGVLAERFDVICGGPESVAQMGFLPGPSWQGDAVYLPSYAPLYGAAADVARAAERLIEAELPVWAPIVLHPGWEKPDHCEGVRALARTIEGNTASWTEFLDAVDGSRSAADD